MTARAWRHLIAVIAVVIAVSGAIAGDVSAGFAPGSVLITGALEDRTVLSFAELAAIQPTHTVNVTFMAGSATEHHTFTGPLLYDVLNLFAPKFDPNVKNDRLRFYVSATGADDYQAIVAWGEFDPGFQNKQILLAVTQDGVSLESEGPRLVVPGDIRGGRYVSTVVTVDLARARENAPCPNPHFRFWWFWAWRC